MIDQLEDKIMDIKFETKYADKDIPAILSDSFNRLREIFPSSKIVIGGGAVRDALMGREPKDIDFFFLNNGMHNTFKKAKEFILERTRNLKKTEHVLEWHKSEPFLVTSIQEGNKEIQIMSRDIKSVGELLDTFDWNVSLFAYDGEKIWFRTAIEDIGKGKELILQKCTYPLSTLRRGFRFSERFLMKINKEDINHICKKILAL